MTVWEIGLGAAALALGGALHGSAGFGMGIRDRDPGARPGLTTSGYAGAEAPGGKGLGTDVGAGALGQLPFGDVSFSHSGKKNESAEGRPRTHGIREASLQALGKVVLGRTPRCDFYPRHRRRISQILRAGDKVVENKWKTVGEYPTLPLFRVPEAPRYRLERAPLVQALAQVRYPLIAALETMPGIAPLQEALRGTFPYMEQELVQEVSLVVGPAGPAGGGSAASVTWKLTNDAEALIVIGAGSATLSAGASYTTVEAFSADFERVLDALASVGVPRCDRLGVRYLSLAPDLPGESRSWRRWFKPELLGWAGSEFVAEGALETSVNQVMLRQPPTGDLAGPPAEVQAVVRHGAVSAGTEVPGIPPLRVSNPSYLLDLDVFVAGHQPFDSAEILKQFAMFHRQIDSFFYWSLTKEGAEHFGMVHDS